jgi:hypothetical protein
MLNLPRDTFVQLGIRNQYDTTLTLSEKGEFVEVASLGSLLESTLQMFLSFNYRFYIESKWNIWDEEAIKQIREKFFSAPNHIRISDC